MFITLLCSLTLGQWVNTLSFLYWLVAVIAEIRLALLCFKPCMYQEMKVYCRSGQGVFLSIPVPLQARLPAKRLIPSLSTILQKLTKEADNRRILCYTGKNQRFSL